jgi:hypothetical protein
MADACCCTFRRHSSRASCKTARLLLIRSQLRASLTGSRSQRLALETCIQFSHLHTNAFRFRACGARREVRLACGCVGEGALPSDIRFAAFTARMFGECRITPAIAGQERRAASVRASESFACDARSCAAGCQPASQNQRRPVQKRRVFRRLRKCQLQFHSFLTPPTNPIPRTSTRPSKGRIPDAI